MKTNSESFKERTLMLIFVGGSSKKAREKMKKGDRAGSAERRVTPSQGSEWSGRELRGRLWHASTS